MVKMIEGFILNETIGEGNFGLVYRATHKQKTGVFAVKVIPIAKFQENLRLQTYMKNQIEALQSIGVSQYIIRFYQMIKSKHNSYLIYEYCNGGTLLNLIKKEQRLEEKRALLIFKQLLEAFKVLNKNNIMHRDLKPENIFFTSVSTENHEEDSSCDRKKVKLGDFGFCKGFKPDQNLAKTMLGSPIYMAPEVLKGESYTTKADIWSMGVILFQMLYGYCPFESKSIASLINTIDTQSVQLSTKIAVSEKTQNLIKRMLTKDYFRRIGWVELFKIKIDDNGQYIDDLSIAANSEQNKAGSNKKIFSSLFTSLSIGTSPITQNNRSYSMIRDEQTKDNQIYQPHQDPPVMHRKISEIKQTQSRVSSQPKDQKRFYSQNYMNILSTPLSLKKIEQNQNINNSIDKPKLISSYDKNDKEHSPLPQNILNSSPPPPLIFHEERLTSMDCIDLVNRQSPGLNSNIEAIPFNKYRENIGLGSNLSNRFLSDRNIKQISRPSANVTGTFSSFLPLSEAQLKRQNLLKIHEGAIKMLIKCMGLVQESLILYKESKKKEDFTKLKQIFQQTYVVLKISQQRLKLVTESINITQTSLFDMASIAHSECIQVQKFIIQIRNELVKFEVQLPNLQNGGRSKLDRIENISFLKQFIKNKNLQQILIESF